MQGGRDNGKRGRRRHSNNFSDEDRGWKHDKFNDVDSGYERKQSGKGNWKSKPQNSGYGYEGKPRGSYHGNKTWRHDKYDQFERGFKHERGGHGRPSEGGSRGGQYRKKKRWDNYEEGEHSYHQHDSPNRERRPRISSAQGAEMADLAFHYAGDDVTAVLRLDQDPRELESELEDLIGYQSGMSNTLLEVKIAVVSELLKYPGPQTKALKSLRDSLVEAYLRLKKGPS